jgi:hypothetical protein
MIRFTFFIPAYPAYPAYRQAGGRQAANRFQFTIFNDQF